VADLYGSGRRVNWANGDLEMEPFALTIAEAAKLGGPCRSALYEDIRNGRLRAVKRGRSTRILVEDFRRYLASLPPVQSRVDALGPDAGQMTAQSHSNT
jgi:excisionase family DNA binding protein